MISHNNNSAIAEHVDQVSHGLIHLRLKSCRISHPEFSHEQIQPVVAALKSASSLRKLDIVQCSKLNPRDVVDICEALQNTHVSHLSLEGVTIGVEGLISLTRLLKERQGDEKKRIKWLGLEGSVKDIITNNIDDNDDDTVASNIDELVWKEFVSVACETLESLDLSHNQLSLRHLTDLANGIANKKCKLTALILSNNPIGDVGMDMICQSLKQNRTMVLLACGECDLSTKTSVEILTETLRVNTSLQRVYLYGNKNDDNNSGKTSEEMRYWMKLNAHGRAFLQCPEHRTEVFLHLILGRISDQPTILHGLLQQVPHVLMER